MKYQLRSFHFCWNMLWLIPQVLPMRESGDCADCNICQAIAIKGWRGLGGWVWKVGSERRSLGSPEAELQSEHPQFMPDHLNPGDSKHTQNTNTKTENTNTWNVDPQFMIDHLNLQFQAWLLIIESDWHCWNAEWWFSFSVTTLCVKCQTQDWQQDIRISSLCQITDCKHPNPICSN